MNLKKYFIRYNVWIAILIFIHLTIPKSNASNFTLNISSCSHMMSSHMSKKEIWYLMLSFYGYIKSKKDLYITNLLDFMDTILIMLPFLKKIKILVTLYFLLFLITQRVNIPVPRFDQVTSSQEESHRCHLNTKYLADNVT